MPAVLQRLARHAHITTTLTFYVAQGAAEIASDLWEGWAATNGKNSDFGNIGQETAKNLGEFNLRKSFR